MIKFVVVEEELTLLLSRKAAEKMKLITVNYDKFQSVRGGGGGGGGVEDQHDTPQDFLGAICCLSKRLPIELRGKVKKNLTG